MANVQPKTTVSCAKVPVKKQEAPVEKKIVPVKKPEVLVKIESVLRQEPEVSVKEINHDASDQGANEQSPSSPSAEKSETAYSTKKIKKKMWYN